MASGIAILLNGLIQQLEAANSGSDSALFNTGIELLRRLTGLPVMCIHITDMSCILQLLMYILSCYLVARNVKSIKFCIYCTFSFQKVVVGNLMIICNNLMGCCVLIMLAYHCYASVGRSLETYGSHVCV